MLKIEGHDIYLTRKNDATLIIDFYRSGEISELDEDEQAFFTVRKQFDSDVIFQKKVVDNRIEISEKDSDLVAGTYVYDLTVLKNEQLTTIIPYHRFTIVDEVY